MKIQLSEYEECLLLVEYLDLLQAQGKVQLYTHIPNETYTKSWGVKIKNKKQGVRKGFPDYVVVLTDKVIFLEMKKAKGGVVSKEQKQWLDALSSLGHIAVACRGFDDAREVLERQI